MTNTNIILTSTKISVPIEWFGSAVLIGVAIIALVVYLVVRKRKPN